MAEQGVKQTGPGPAHVAPPLAHPWLIMITLAVVGATLGDTAGHHLRSAEGQLLGDVAGALAGITLGGFIWAYKVIRWAHTVTIWSEEITRDVNTWGAKIEAEIAELRKEMENRRPAGPEALPTEQPP